jgi:hypothetical protein
MEMARQSTYTLQQQEGGVVYIYFINDDES